MAPRINARRFRSAGSVLLFALALAACGSMPPTTSSPNASSEPATPSSTRPSSSTLPALPPAGSGRGGYYMDDGPGDAPPQGLLDTPDAEPKVEPYARRGNRPYVVFGKRYTPFTDDRPFKQRGIGSWYGKKFHGQKTSSGEPYDMYKMTAAHPTLPLPSYVRVTNLANGRQVVVRVNDRGPFHSGRIIDLSYTAALKLGYLAKGSSQLEVERLLPAEIERMAAARKEQQARAEQSLPTPEVLSEAAAVQSPAATASAFYLQIGAYAQVANAESARARLMQSAAGILASVEVVEQGTLYRLLSGPFASRDEAAAAAAQLRERGTFKPMVVQR